MRTSRTILRVLAIGSLVWLVVVIVLVALMVWRGEQNRVAEADVIVVLGAGIRRDGSPDLALTRRTLWAGGLYREGYADVLLCSGGIAPDRPRSEADACREILLRMGIPDEAILMEEESRSTEENALYSAPLLVSMGRERVLLVTDSFHMLRATWLFGGVGLHVVGGSPVPREQMRRSHYVSSLGREVVAFHWQVFKTVFGLPFTHVP